LAGVTAVKANTMAEHFIIARIFAPKQQDRFEQLSTKLVMMTSESIRLSDPHCRPKGANMLSPRVLSVLGGLLWLLASSLGPENSLALAQNADDKPADQQSSEPESAKGVQTVTEFAEVQRLLSGPAGNPECVWLGRRVVSLLWRDDMDTAFRHLDLYDRFGCPGGHIQAAFRCLVLNGNIDPKNPETLNGRVQACWVNPSLLAAPASAAVQSSATH
jgi:hypothetical protein